jgi:hypothetical protein
VTVERARRTFRWGRIGAAGALVLGAWAAVAAVDAAVGKVQRDAEARAARALPPAVASAPRAGERAFVLIVDSLRAETADALPALRDLRARGAFLRVRNTQDAATVPSIRAAFTGEPQRSIFAFARNFVKVGGSWSSVFGDLAARGQTSAAFSDGAFFELRGAIAEVHDHDPPPGDDEERQRRGFAQALALFGQGRHRLVVFHVTLGDSAAHATGVGSAPYRRAFETIDALIREADAAVPANETFVVFGDHGHDLQGRHFPGLNIPTVALYRGPGFVPGAVAGPVPLTIHRYLLSWALGLPLPAAYRGGAAPGVLRAEGALPAAYAAPPAEISSVADRRARLAWMLPLYGAIAAVAAFGARRLATRPMPWRAALAASAALVAGFAAWGFELHGWRLAVAPLRATQVWTLWLGVLAVGAGGVGVGLVPPMAVLWAALAVPALLLFPSAGREGWADGMGRVWAIGLAVLVIAWARRRALERAWRLTEAERLALVALPFLACCAMPFFYAETGGLEFNWIGYLTSNRYEFWVVLSVGVRAVLFVRPERGRFATLVGLAVVALLSVVSFGGALAGAPVRLAVAVGLAAAAIAARRHARTRAAASILVNAALLLAFRATVVLDERVFLQLELLLAGLRVTMLVGRVLGRAEDGPSLAAWLEAMALLVTAWSTLALTLYRLEWHILYEFFAPATVEQRIGLFLPVIVGRYALPLVLARRLLAEARPPGDGGAWRAAFGVAAGKTASLVLIASGYAIYDPTSELFTQAIMNVLTFSVPLLALAYEPREVA